MFSNLRDLGCNRNIKETIQDIIVKSRVKDSTMISAQWKKDIKEDETFT